MRVSASVSLSVLAFCLGLTSAASAQESGASLAPPRGGQAGSPAPVDPAVSPSSEAQTPNAQTPNAQTPNAQTPSAQTTQVPGGTSATEPPASGATPATELGTVPPPPPTSYDPAVRYPSGETAGTARPTGFRADASDLAIPSRVATRLRVLDSSLQALAARGGGGVVDGVLSILGGATITGIGIWQYDDSRALGGYLLLWGSSNVIRGVVTLALNPNPSREHVAFTHMPMATMDEVMARLTFGESALEKLARRSKAVRVLDASLNVAAGVAFIPMYLAPNDFKIVDPFDYFILIGSGISVLSGLISLFTRSDAERRWEAYQDLRDRLVREGGDVATREPEGFRVRGAGVAPLRDGAALTLDATF